MTPFQLYIFSFQCALNFNIKYIYFNIEISFNIYDFFLSSLNT